MLCLYTPAKNISFGASQEHPLRGDIIWISHGEGHILGWDASKIALAGMYSVESLLYINSHTA